MDVAEAVPIQKIAKSENAERFTTLSLPNGMAVVLCEDHSQPKIWGAVCVHVGGKNDPADNTGMAHYLEHLMFKGTDQIGTIDWKQEKEYLDEITRLYDKLHGTQNDAVRSSLLKEINDLSNQSVEFAIPNEVDVILNKMGGQGVNAFTSNDVTVYLNSFPSNQLEKWLRVYAERFRNPVFRLFQTELEAVYEEYNMYQDQPVSVFLEDALAEAYGKHPYGRPVIGYQKHLKNPQISAMQDFFNTYYHPNNMTLVLVGDFNSENMEPLLSSTIGQYHNEAEGANPDMAYRIERMRTNLDQKVEPFKGRKVVTVKETPVKMGIIGFQTAGENNPDAFYLEILSNLLNNNEETGLLDKLTNDKKLLSASGFHYSMLEHGLFAFFYVPKILGQSHEDAESHIFAAIDSLKKGNFSDQLFEAVKMSYLKDHLMAMEDLDEKFYLVMEAVTNQQDPNIINKRELMVRRLKKEDIVRLANRYFTDNHLIFRSNIGSKEQEKLQKPDWNPIVAQNTDKTSEYAKALEKMEVKPVEPQHIDFNSDIKEIGIHDNFVLYGAKNTHNDYFTLTIAYDYGNLSDRLFATAVEYFNKQGTEEEDYDQFQLHLQKMGASMEMYSTDDRFYITLSGFDKDLPLIMKLCARKLSAPSKNARVLHSLAEDREGEAKMMKDDAAAWGRALYHYALYGKNSHYLTQLTSKEIKRLSHDALLKSFSAAFGYSGYATYVGKTNIKTVAEFLRGEFVRKDLVEGKRQVRELVKYEKPTLFIASNSKFLQSNIYFYKMGLPVDDIRNQTECLLYNEYMGGSMAGVVFQEIRELRSLGYSAYAAYQYDRLNRRPGYLMGFLGTQSDKTVEGCQAMGELLTRFPKNEEKFEMSRTSLVRSTEADYVNFRDIPGQVQSWKEQHFDTDPRPAHLKILENESMEQLSEFYSQIVDKAPLVITIAGDKSRINLKELSKQYNIVELKYKDFVNE